MEFIHPQKFAKISNSEYKTGFQGISCSQTLLPRKIGKEIKQKAESIESSILPRSAFVCFFCRELSCKKLNCQECSEIRYWQEIRLKITKGL